MTAAQGPIGKASVHPRAHGWAWGGTGRGSDLQQVASGWAGHKSSHTLATGRTSNRPSILLLCFRHLKKPPGKRRTRRAPEAHGWRRSHGAHPKETETPDILSLFSPL